MSFLISQILLCLAAAFLLGLVVGGLMAYANGETSREELQRELDAALQPRETPQSAEGPTVAASEFSALMAERNTLAGELTNATERIEILKSQLLERVEEHMGDRDTAIHLLESVWPERVAELERQLAELKGESHEE